MSYILDALKKAAEQRSGPPSEMRRLLSPAPVPPDSLARYITLGVVGASVIGVAVVVWMWGPSAENAVPPATPVASVVPLPVVPAPATVETTATLRETPATAANKPSADKPAVAVEPPRTAADGRRVSAAAADTAKAATSAPAKPAPSETAKTATAETVTTSRATRAATAGTIPGARSADTKPPRTPAAPTPTSVAPAPPIVAAVPPASTTPAPIRTDVGKLKVEVIVYSEQRPLRWAFISGRKYVEGDAIGEGARVEEIQSGGVVIVEDGRRVTLRP